MTFATGDGAIPGEYSVKVFKFEKGTGPVDPNAPPMTFEEEQKLPTTNEKPASPAKNLLPAKYAIFQYFPHGPKVPDNLPPAVSVHLGKWKLMRISQRKLRCRKETK